MQELHGTHETFTCVPMGTVPKIPFHVPWFIRLKRECGMSGNFVKCPLIDDENVQLDMEIYVDGTFCMNDGNMLLESFFKGKFQKIINQYIP